MKHLLKMSDLSPAELHHILDVAEELKAEQKAGTTPALLKGRSVALMFSKNSTRTRTSFEVGVYQLGGLGNYMNAATELQSGRGEPLKDTARVLGRYYDCVVWRTYRQRDLEEFAEQAGVPVINIYDYKTGNKTGTLLNGKDLGGLPLDGYSLSGDEQRVMLETAVEPLYRYSYYAHHFVPSTRVGKFLRKYHLMHHHGDEAAKYGVSSPLWDVVFRTWGKALSRS